jgi:hypothetical protein
MEFLGPKAGIEPKNFASKYQPAVKLATKFYRHSGSRYGTPRRWVLTPGRIRERESRTEDAESRRIFKIDQSLDAALGPCLTKI